jgi:hypothetical protein
MGKQSNIWAGFAQRRHLNTCEKSAWAIVEGEAEPSATDCDYPLGTQVVKPFARRLCKFETRSLGLDNGKPAAKKLGVGSGSFHLPSGFSYYSLLFLRFPRPVSKL